MTDDELLTKAQAFVDRKYVARSDARQKSMGLAYVEAERQDLAREIARFAKSVTGAPAQPEQLKLEWRDGPPPKPWSEEWFIALTTYGDRVVLRALPEEWTYDFKTADETYIKADKIKRWMQFPDSNYIAPAAQPPAAPLSRSDVEDLLNTIHTQAARIEELERAPAAPVETTLAVNGPGIAERIGMELDKRCSAGNVDLRTELARAICNPTRSPRPVTLSDQLDAVLAIVERISAAPQGVWQSVETAPKDGTVIDGWLVSLSGNFEPYRKPDIWWSDKQGCWKWDGQWGGSQSPNIAITHWMPKPSSPLSRPEQK